MRVQILISNIFRMQWRSSRAQRRNRRLESTGRIWRCAANGRDCDLEAAFANRASIRHIAALDKVRILGGKRNAFEGWPARRSFVPYAPARAYAARSEGGSG